MCEYDNCVIKQTDNTHCIPDVSGFVPLLVRLEQNRTNSGPFLISLQFILVWGAKMY